MIQPIKSALAIGMVAMLGTLAAAQESKPSREEIIRQLVKDFGISPAAAEKDPWKKILDQDNWYHQSRVMDWPQFDPVSTRTVAPAGGQADHVCTGKDDDLIIQKAIDSLPERGGKVVVLPGVYLLGNCIRPKDNTELEIRGTLKVADAVRSELTADVRASQTTVQVADASRFRAGQWVTLMDDDPRKNHKGGRKYGESVTVKSMQGNTLTVSDRLGVNYAKAKWAIDGYSVAKKAFVATSYSAVLVLSRQRVYIHGGEKPGEIDGNKGGQAPTAPLALGWGGEDLAVNCGIAVVDSSWVKVENLCIHDANLHNVALFNSRDCEVAGVEAARCNDKNLCVVNVNKLRVFGNHCHDSVVEDGICCHSPGGPYILIAKNRMVDNPRYGIHVGLVSPCSLVLRNVATAPAEPSKGVGLDTWRESGQAKQAIVWLSDGTATGDVPVELATRRAEGDQLELTQRLINASDRPASFRCELIVTGRPQRETHVAALAPGDSDVKVYRVANGSVLRGKILWGRIQEVDGNRTLRYRVVVEP